MKNFFKNDLKLLGMPLAILTGILLLALISTQIIINNLSTLNSQINDNQKKVDMLQQKLSLLQTVGNEPSNSNQPVVVTTALPAKNSALAALNEIQTSASSSTLVITNLTSSNITLKANSALATTEIDFEADGQYGSIASFIEKLKNSAPITRFNSIKISGGGTGSNFYRLSASIFSYWAPLPTTLPAISESITGLTPDEQKIYNQVSALDSGGVFIQSSSLPVNSGRSNPFTQ